MPNSDLALIRLVHSEQRTGPTGKFNISASITRFGTLTVIAYTDDWGAQWQGDSIIHARNWVDRGPKRDKLNPELK